MKGHWFKIDRALASAAGIGYGDIAELDLQIASDWPEPDVPSDLAKALASAPTRGFSCGYC